MKRLLLLCVCTAAGLIAGCGGNRHDPAPPAPAATQFTSIVKQVLVVPADTGTPIEVNTLMIAYADDNNPAAFNDVLPPAG